MTKNNVTPISANVKKITVTLEKVFQALQAWRETLGAEVQKSINEHWELIMSLLVGVKANWVVLWGRP